MGRITLASSIAIVALLVVACEASDSSTGSSAGAGADGGELPRCELPPGTTSGPSGAPTTAALPSGSCAEGTSACAIGAEVPCDCPFQQGPVNDYRCECTGGQWSCAIVSQGGAACVCGADASADAATD